MVKTQFRLNCQKYLLKLSVQQRKVRNDLYKYVYFFVAVFDSFCNYYW